MKKIYLCGPITGRPDYERHFLTAEETLLYRINAEGLRIKTLNPSRFPLKTAPWETCMRYAVRAMLTCDGIALLRGWENSRGCRMELSLAGQLKIPVVYLEPPADTPAILALFDLYSDVHRYFGNRIERLETEGRDAEDCKKIAFLETCNRFLDPHGFEYIEARRP
ncbi:MAG: DUF4406 domain-containing protein [Treponema sp.]|jgi:hypothetical protein|nr:DUF4406 domain-containing protein [Treponema sp.]